MTVVRHNIRILSLGWLPALDRAPTPFRPLAIHVRLRLDCQSHLQRVGIEYKVVHEYGLLNAITSNSPCCIRLKLIELEIGLYLL
jgi:hypothetical protein